MSGKFGSWPIASGLIGRVIADERDEIILDKRVKGNMSIHRDMLKKIRNGYIEA